MSFSFFFLVTFT
jgi:cyclophilin family peptidyl-prolyl cis-trans isomerase